MTHEGGRRKLSIFLKRFAWSTGSDHSRPEISSPASQLPFALAMPSIPVYYINLDYREDRRKLSEKLWREQFGMRSVTRVPGVPDTLGRRGGTKAHLRALDTILEHGDGDPFVILAEDDVELLPGKDPEDVARIVTNALNNLQDLNVIFFTASLHHFKKTKLEGVVRLQRNGAKAMPALVIRGTYISKLRAIYEKALMKNRPHDKLTKKVHGRDHWYALDPPLMRQASGYSNIEKKHVDYGPENR